MLTKAVLLLSLVFVPVLAFGQAEGAKLPVLSPGVYEQTIFVDGTAFRFAISIPAGHSNDTPVPLVLALHFGGSPTRGYGSSLLSMLVRPALSELGAIMIAPDALGSQWSNPQNDQAVIALLDTVLNTYNIDRKKMILTGFSMGGAGTWFFAGKYPERFSAAIPISGRPNASAEGWKLPVLAIHSQADQVVPIGPARMRIEELQKAGVKAQMIELTGIGHHETNRFVPGLRRAVPWVKEIWGAK